MNYSTLKLIGGLIPGMDLKDRILEAMEAAKLSKSEFADATKTSPGAVTQWINGATKSLKAVNANRIEAVTGYRATWLVSGKGEKLVGKVGAEEKRQATALPNNYESEIHVIAKWLHDLPNGYLKDKAIKACMKIAFDADAEASRKPSPDSAISETDGKQHA